MKQYVLGVDPGASGAFAWYNVTDGLLEKLWHMPNTQMTLTTGKKTNRVDISKVVYMFTQLQEFVTVTDSKMYVHIEKVHAFGKQSAPAAFNFGYAAAVPHVIAECCELPVKLIAPQTWKRQFNLQASEKDESRQLVIRMFPQFAYQLRHKKDVDLADAALIAMYRP